MVMIPTMSRNTEKITGLEDKIVSSAAVRHRSGKLEGEVKVEDIDQEVLS